MDASTEGLVAAPEHPWTTIQMDTVLQGMIHYMVSEVKSHLGRHKK